MERFEFLPIVAAGTVALFVCHLGLQVLPDTISGLSTPILLMMGMGGALFAAIRYL